LGGSAKGAELVAGPSLLKTALGLRAAGKLLESLDTFTRAIMQDPRMGRPFSNAESFTPAWTGTTPPLRILLKLCDSRQDNAVAYHARGVAYLSKGEYEKALPDFDKAALRLPRDATVFFNRALAYASMDRHPQPSRVITRPWLSAPTMPLPWSIAL